MSFRVNKDIKIISVFHLLLFLLKDGDVCYFTSSIKLQKNIINFKENYETSIEFSRSFMADTFLTRRQILPQKVLIEIKKAVQKSIMSYIL